MNTLVTLRRAGVDDLGHLRIDFDLKDDALWRSAYGDCHFLTIALAETTGWQPVVLHDGRYRSNLSYLHDYGEPVHSAVLTPDGFILDAHGVRVLDIDEIAIEYGEEEYLAWRPDAAPSLDDMAAILPPDGGDRPAKAAVLAERILITLAPHMGQIASKPTVEPAP